MKSLSRYMHAYMDDSTCTEEENCRTDNGIDCMTLQEPGWGRCFVVVVDCPMQGL